MRRHGAAFWVVAVVVAALASGPGHGYAAQPKPRKKDAGQPAKKEEPVDLFVKGEAAFRQKRYAAAIHPLRDFIGGSVGDARLGDAKEMLFQAYREQAGKYERIGVPAGGARVLVEGADYFKKGDQADALRDSARKTLRAAFDASRAADPDAAADAAAEHARLFKDDPPLADAKAFYQLRVDALAQLVARKAPAELLWTRASALLADGVPPKVLADQKVDLLAIERAYADELVRRQWYARAVDLLGDLAQNSTEERDRKKYQTLLSKTLGAYAEACLATGNHDLIEEAWAVCEAWPGSLNTQGGAKLKRARAKAAGNKPEPIAVPTDNPLVGEGNLGQAGATISIRGQLKVGDDKGDGRKDGVVTVPAGALLKGGKIYVEEGRLLIKGEPNRPVILRGVELSADLGGSVVAQHAVFVDCKFSKAGGWYFPFYTTHWTLENCLLLRSNFPHLDKTNYGIKFKESTFVECTIPSRILNDGAVEDDDLAARYRDEWNGVDECDFLLCEVKPSFVWATERCNFSICRVGGADVYSSKTPLDVILFAPKADASFWRDLRANTDIGHTGQLEYALSKTGYAHKSMAPLWPWLPAGKAEAGE